MFGFWSIQGFFVFLLAMDQGWKRLPLLVVFLFLSSTYGFKGGAYSHTHTQWGQPSDNTFSPRAVQSSVSEVPVTGTLPEVGSSLLANRSLKRFNLLQFVKGHDSSHHELMSHAQTAPSSSVFASLPLPLSEKHAGSLTLLPGSGATITDTASVSTQGTSGQSTRDQSFPSLYMSSSSDLSPQSQTSSQLLPSSLEVSSQFTNGQSSPGLYIGSSKSSSDSQSIGPASFLDTQGSLSHSILSTQTQGSTSTSQGSAGPELSGSYSVFQSLNNSSQYAPGSLMYGKFGPLPIRVSSQSTSTQSSSGTPLTSSHFPVQGGSSSISSLYLKPQGTLGLYTPVSSTKYVRVPLPQRAVYSQATSSSGAQFGTSAGYASQGMSSTYSGSVQPQGTTIQFAPGSPSSYPSVSLSSPQGAASQSATVPSSQKQFTFNYGTQSGSSLPLTLQGSANYGGSLQPQGTTSQFAPGSSLPSMSLSSPQGAASQSATVPSSRKQFTSTFTGSFATAPSSRKQFASSYGTQSGSSLPLTLQGSAAYGGSLQPQGTTGQFAPGSSLPSMSLSSPQGAASQSATVQSSRKQFTSSYGTQSGSSLPLTLQGSAAYGGSLQPQGTTGQFAPGSSFPSISPSSPQGAASQSATVLSSLTRFSSAFTGSSGTQSGSSLPLTLQGSANYGGSLQPQGTTSTSYSSISPSSPQGVASQPSQALSSSVSQSQKSQRWQPSQGIQTSVAATSHGSDPSQSSPVQSRFSSQSSAGGPSSGGSGRFVSAQGGSTHGGFALNSRSPFNKYNPGSHAYVKFASSPLAVSSPYTSDQHSNGLYSSDTLQTQGLFGIVKRPSSQAPFDSPSNNQISEHFVTLQHPTGSNVAPSLGLSAQESSVGMRSGIPQTALDYTSLRKFSSNYGAPSEPGVYGQGTSGTSASELLSSYDSMYNLNAPASIPSHSSFSSRYHSVKG